MIFELALALISQGWGAPCEIIARPADHWGHFVSSVTVADVSVRATEGLAECRFDRAGVGSCLLIRPKTVLVEEDGRQTWFAVPADRGADVRVDRSGVRCTTRPLVTTD